MKLIKRLTPEYEGGFTKFKRVKADRFEHDDTSGKLFSSYERATIIRYIIEVNAGVDINRGIEKKQIAKCFTLHDKAKMDAMIHKYITTTGWWKPMSQEGTRTVFQTKF